MENQIKKELKSIEMNPLKRMFHSMPKYFKMLMYFGISLIGVALSIKEMPIEMQSHLPIEIINYSNYVIAIGGAIVFMSNQTINKEKVLEKLKAKYSKEEEIN